LFGRVSGKAAGTGFFRYVYSARLGPVLGRTLPYIGWTLLAYDIFDSTLGPYVWPIVDPIIKPVAEFVGRLIGADQWGPALLKWWNAFITTPLPPFAVKMIVRPQAMWIIRPGKVQITHWKDGKVVGRYYLPDDLDGFAKAYGKLVADIGSADGLSADGNYSRDFVYPPEIINVILNAGGHYLKNGRDFPPLKCGPNP
jgi:hypothetical protein